MTSGTWQELGFTFKTRRWPKATLTVSVVWTDEETLGQMKQLAREGLRLLVADPENWDEI